MDALLDAIETLKAYRDLPAKKLPPITRRLANALHGLILDSASRSPDLADLVDEKLGNDAEE